MPRNSPKQREAARRAKTKHGMFHTRFYKTFYGIKSRCNNTRDKRYYDYGGRGITCAWKSFEEFRDDMYESYLEHSLHGEKNTFIERLDNNKGYSKENCCWATRIEQANNKRNVIRVFIPSGTYTVTELARFLKTTPNYIYAARHRVKNSHLSS